MCDNACKTSDENIRNRMYGYKPGFVLFNSYPYNVSEKRFILSPIAMMSVSYSGRLYQLHQK